MSLVGLCGDWAAARGSARGWLRRGGCTRQGAQSGRGARRTAPSTPWTGRAIAAPGPPSSQPPGRHAAPTTAVFFPKCPPGHLQTASPATPPPHFIGFPQPRERPVLQVLQENNGSGPSTQSALLPPPEPRHSSTPSARSTLGSAALRLHHFLRSPPRGLRCRLTGSTQRVASGLGVPRSGSRSGGRRGEWGEGGGGRTLSSPSLPPPLAAAAWTLAVSAGAREPGARAAPGRLGKSHRPAAGRWRKPRLCSLARELGAAALAETHRRETRSAQPKASDVIRNVSSISYFSSILKDKAYHFPGTGCSRLIL